MQCSPCTRHSTLESGCAHDDSRSVPLHRDGGVRAGGQVGVPKASCAHVRPAHISVMTCHRAAAIPMHSEGSIRTCTIVHLAVTVSTPMRQADTASAGNAPTSCK